MGLRSSSSIQDYSACSRCVKLIASFLYVTITRVGWTLFDKMYLLNGTVYLVTNEPANFPDRKFMTSKGHDIENGPEKYAARLPTDSEMRIISPEEAKKLFGTSATRVQGVTVRRFALSLATNEHLTEKYSG